jgi:transposase
LADFVLPQGGTRKAAAAAFRVSAKTAGKWVRRYQSAGLGGLMDRSSRPRHSPRRLPESLSSRVIELRSGHMPDYEIARRTGLSAASVSRILRRARLSRWRDLNPPPPVLRYEHERPGDLVHLDIKGMTRFNEVSRRGDGPMVASITSRPSAAPTVEQPLDYLHPPPCERVHHPCAIFLAQGWEATNSCERVTSGQPHRRWLPQAFQRRIELAPLSVAEFVGG